MTEERRRAGIVTVAGLVAVALCILLVDRPVADFAHALHRPVWCVWLTWIADVPAPASGAGLAGCGLAWLFGWRPGPLGRVVLAVCLATLAADAAKDVLKVAFGRTWPETWVGGNPSWINQHVYGFFPFHGGAGWASFPSGHVTVIAAPCTVLWRCWPQLRVIWAGLVVAVIVGLIGADFHFLSDCLAGGLLGTAVASAVLAYPSAGQPS